jgi:type II secretory pathway pseudopilin PulG
MHQMTRRCDRQRGVALLEVAIAMGVMSVAFLAIAMLVATTARSQRSGQAMVRAAALANDIAEQMRANRNAVEAVAPGRGFVLEEAYAVLTMTDALAVPTCGGRFVRPPSIDQQLKACDTAKGFADFALASWLTQVQTSLPGGAGSVVDLTGGRRRIAIAWTEPLTDRSEGKPAPLTDKGCDQVPTLKIEGASGVRCLIMDFSL